MLNCSITPFYKFLQCTTCDTLRNENDICIINVSKRITLTHTHVVPSRWIVFTLAVERSTEPLVRDCSYFSLIAVSLSPSPTLSSLLIVSDWASFSHATLSCLLFHTHSLSLSISVSFSFTYSPSNHAASPSLSVLSSACLLSFTYFFIKLTVFSASRTAFACFWKEDI